MDLLRMREITALRLLSFLGDIFKLIELSSEGWLWTFEKALGEYANMD